MIGMKRILGAILVVFLVVVSCGEEAPRQTIPFARVYFRVAPNGYDHILRNPDSYKLFTGESGHPSSEHFGYAGVLVVSDAKGVLHAFDLCCPHEDNRQVKVDPDYEETGYSGKVKCTSCGSVFVTLFGLGNVEEGPSAEPLQKYNVMPLGDGSYRVVN